MSDVSLSLASSDFELFQIPARFTQDRAAIDARWKDLQREAHPDKFAAHGAAAQRLAMQWSVRINEAYQRLKDPLTRASYLCERGGVPVNAESNTAMPAQFLMQQMDWREALEEARTAADVDQLHAQVMAARHEALQQCAQALDEEQDLAQGVALVRSLMFMERFCDDIEKCSDALAAPSTLSGST